jgi:cytochrome P450
MRAYSETENRVAVAAAAPYQVHRRHRSLNSFARYREVQRFWNDPVGYMWRRYAKEGAFSAFGGKRAEYVFAFTPEMNKQLNENADIFYWAGNKNWKQPSSSLNILRASIGNMDGPEYQLRKALMRPAFHHDSLEAARQKMVSRTGEMLSGWSHGQVRDLHMDVRKLVHAISMAAVLGIEDQVKIDTLFRLVDEIYARSGNPLAILLPYDLPLLPFRNVVRTGDEIISALRSIIRLKRVSEGKSLDMLSMMMHSRTEEGATLSEDGLISETYNIMGHDTTVSALLWILILIAIHPKVQEKLVEELRGSLHGSAPTLAELNQFAYLDAVIKESMRLMPPQCFSRRTNVEACRLGPYELEPGTVIFMSSYITHRLPGIYSDAMRFLPERWETLRPTPYEYFPFGSGAHYCVGRAFALAEIKIVLAMILQRYKLEFPPGRRIDRMPGARLLLSPKGAVAIRIERHNGSFSSSPVIGEITEMVALN